MIDQTPAEHSLEKSLHASMLNRKLTATNRPTVESLKHDNIVKENFKGKELEKAIHSDQLKGGLEGRERAESLKEKGILKDGMRARAESLNKEMKKDKLGKELAKEGRPSVDEVKDSGILKDGMRVRAER